MFVKICGTTNLPDAELAVHLGADALGFIFAPSKRRVCAEQAAEITRSLPDDVLRVGILTAPDVVEIARVVSTARLHAVQMHWAYDADVVSALRAALGEDVVLWQVVGFPVAAENSDGAEELFMREVRAALRDRRLAALLLDAVKGSASGGLGVAFPWERAAALMEADRAKSPLPIMLAGGLHAGNVRKAIQTMRPWGVDVVSGVEDRPGSKAREKLRAFFHQVRAEDMS